MYFQDRCPDGNCVFHGHRYVFLENGMLLIKGPAHKPRRPHRACTHSDTVCFCLTSFLSRVTPDLATKETVFTRQMPLMLPQQQHNHWPRLFSADSHEAGMPHTVTCLRSQYLANLNQEQNLSAYHSSTIKIRFVSINCACVVNFNSVLEGSYLSSTCCT